MYVHMYNCESKYYSIEDFWFCVCIQDCHFKCTSWTVYGGGRACSSRVTGKVRTLNGNPGDFKLISTTDRGTHRSGQHKGWALCEWPGHRAEHHDGEVHCRERVSRV